MAGGGSAPGSKNRGELFAAIDRGQRQIELLGERLAPWKAIAPRLAPARLWLARRAAAMASADRKEVERWAPVVTQQQAILFEASGELIDVLELAASSGADGADAPGQAAFRDVLAAYATAIGESHLVDSARAALAGARARKAKLPVALARATVRESSAAANELADATGAAPGSEGALALERQQQIERAQLSIEAKAMQGQPVHADELDAVTLGAAEHSFRTRLAVLRQKMGLLDRMLEDVDKSVVQATVNTLAGEVRQLRRSMAGIVLEIGRIDRSLARAGKAEAAAFDGDAQQRERWLRQAKREALTAAEHSLAHLAEREQFETLSQRVKDEVGDAQMRALVAEIIFLIGTSVLSAGVAGALGVAARGAMLARTTGNAARLLAAAPRIRLASGAIELGSEAALNAAFQTLAGGDMGSSFLENLLADAATLAALAPLRQLVRRVGAADEAVAGLWQRAGRAGKLVLGKSAILSAEMITAAAASYAAHMAIHGRPDTPDTVTGWLIQGASMAAGRFVASRMTGLVERMSHMAERGAFLRQRAAVQRQRAEDVVKSGDEGRALELLAAQKQLLDEETELLSMLERDGAAREQAGLSPYQLGLLRQGNRDARVHLADPAYHELPFRLEGLDEVVPGARWSGDPDRIAAALDHARRAGIPVEVVRHDETTGRWDIRLGDRHVVLDERIRGPRPLEQATDLKKWKAAREQETALAALEGGTATVDQRKHLADELRRQVPDIALVDAVRTGTARSVLSIVNPGGGETGIKHMNDELIGQALHGRRGRGSGQEGRRDRGTGEEARERPGDQQGDRREDRHCPQERRPPVRRRQRGAVLHSRREIA